MHPISQDQWQIAKFILEFKSTHPKYVNFDWVRVGSIFAAFRLIIVQCVLDWFYQKEHAENTLSNMIKNVRFYSFLAEIY